MKTVEIYADTRGVSKCSSPRCGKRILWAQVVKTGRKMCFDDTDLPALRTRHDPGSRRLIEEVDLDANHWATCPDARKFNASAPSKAPAATKPRTHQCYVSYCDKQIPETYLMCPPHWSKVKPETMREVWKWYRAKMADPDNDSASVAHWKAIEQARREVESRESGPLLGASDDD